jgi:surface rod structure-forming protein G
MPRKSWWARLPFGVRMATGASALLITVVGGVAGVAALTRDDGKPQAAGAVEQSGAGASPAGQVSAPTGRRPVVPRPLDPAGASAPRTSDQADRTATRNPRSAAPARANAAAPAASTDRPRPVQPQAAAPAGPVTTTRTETETREIPYETQLVRDPLLPRGSKRVDQPGVPGEQTLNYLVTLTDGQPTDRRLVDATVTRQPQNRVVAFGTGRDRECGHRPLHVCVPLGRSAPCPTPTVPDAFPEQVPGALLEPVPDIEPLTTDELTAREENDLALLATADLDGLEQLTC